MALGFQDCCNEYSFFYLDSTPAYVSEFEVYSIQTAQGFTFCAKYREIPALNYEPPTYTLVAMTEYENCDTCISANPCPLDEVILSNQFIEGSVAEGQDCNFTTIIQMVVEPILSNPTEFDSNDGRVAFNIVGGTQPYIFYNTDTQEILPVIQNGNLYIVYDNVPEGSYFITITDANSDFSVSNVYILDAPPSPPDVVCVPSNASFFGASDGSINLNITNGTPPYVVIYQGSAITLPLTGLFAGNYNFIVQDQNFSVPITCEVTEPAETNFPNELCLNFVFCGNTFRLNFSRQGPLYNLRPQYVAVYPQVFGLNQMTIRYETSNNRWETTTETCNPANIQFLNPPGNCNYGNNQVKFVANPSSQPSTLWSGSAGMVQGLVANVGSFFCPPTAIFVSATDYCAGPPAILSSVVVAANGGSGPPYTYSYSTGGGNYINSSTPLLSLVGGNYSLRVTDNDGNQSSPISFTVPTRVFTIDSSSPGNFNVCAIYNRTYSGIVAQPIVNGQFQQCILECEYYFDFLPFDDETSFNTKIQIYFQLNTFAGGPSDNDPRRYQEFVFTIPEAYVINNGVVTNFMTNPTDLTVGINSSVQLLGSGTLFGVNSNKFTTGLNADQCPSNPTVFRLANGWKTCNISFDFIRTFRETTISNDIISSSGGAGEGIGWSSTYNYKGDTVTINRNTKMAIKVRFFQKNYRPPYAPPFKLATGPETLQPEFYTPQGQSLLNQPNTTQTTYFTNDFIQAFRISFIDITQATGCINFPVSNPNNIFDVPKLAFFSSCPITDTSGAPTNAVFQGSNVNLQIYPAANTCSTPPSWAL